MKYFLKCAHFYDGVTLQCEDFLLTVPCTLKKKMHFNTKSCDFMWIQCHRCLLSRCFASFRNMCFNSCGFNEFYLRSTFPFNHNLVLKKRSVNTLLWRIMCSLIRNYGFLFLSTVQLLINHYAIIKLTLSKEILYNLSSLDM